MRSIHVLPVLATLALTASLPALAAPPLVTFSGAIGVDPLTAAGGADTLNTVRGIAPGGRAWILRRLKASVERDGTITARGNGLLFSSGEAIGTRGAVGLVAATLACGPATPAAALYHSAPTALDEAGNFHLRSALTQDGVNAAVMPERCDNPVLLIRGVNASTGALGGWFAAGIPGDGAPD